MWYENIFLLINNFPWNIYAVHKCMLCHLNSLLLVHVQVTSNFSILKVEEYLCEDTLMDMPDKWIEGCDLFSLLMCLARPFVCMHTSMADLYQHSVKELSAHITVGWEQKTLWPKESSQWFKKGEKRVTGRGQAKWTFLVQNLIHAGKGHKVQLSSKWACVLQAVSPDWVLTWHDWMSLLAWSQ